MKTENTIENKTKFFALYWGQNLWFKKDWADFKSDNSIKIEGDFLNTIDENDCIFLKPLSTITDEDSLYVAKIIGYNFDWKPVKNITRGFTIATLQHDTYGLCYLYKDLSFGRENFEADYHKLPKVVDYLRSKGYALPYMDLSVEDLIEYGWIKLK